MNRVLALWCILFKIWRPFSPAVLGIILNLSLFAIFFFLSLVPLPSSTCNPFIPCVWSGVRTPRHQPSPPAQDAQTLVGHISSCTIQCIPEKLISAREKLQSSSLPLQKAQMPSFPWALNHHQVHAQHLTPSFPAPSRVFPLHPRRGTGTGRLVCLQGIYILQ